MNALALDVGDRYIGIAATDHADPIAYRYATIDRKKSNTMKELTAAKSATGADTILVGVPYHIEDGSETAQTQKTYEFIQDLRAFFGDTVTVVEADETLTSREAKKTLQLEGADISQEHAEAARILLQEFIAQGT